MCGIPPAHPADPAALEPLGLREAIAAGPAGAPISPFDATTPSLLPYFGGQAAPSPLPTTPYQGLGFAARESAANLLALLATQPLPLQ